MQKMTLRDGRTWSLYCRLVQTGLDKSEHKWSAIFPQPWFTHCPILAHPQTCVPFSNSTSLETLRPFEVVETALRHASIGIRGELVWSATFLGNTSKSDTSLESSRLAKFEYEISPGYDVRQKSYALGKKGHYATRFNRTWTNYF